MSKLNATRWLLVCAVICGCAQTGQDGDDPVADPGPGQAEASHDLTTPEPEFFGAEAEGSAESRQLPENAVPFEGSPNPSDKAASGCRTYYGGCSGFWWGTSCAEGEGWRYCVTVGQTYAWMTICGDTGSYPSSYGQGWCLF